MPIDLTKFMPMLSATLPCAKARVPTQEEIINDLKDMDWSRGFWCSPKADGIRAAKTPDGLVSRTLKPIPNRIIQKALENPIYNYLDGELINGAPTDFLASNEAQSVVMAYDSDASWSWLIFDQFYEPLNAFRHRWDAAKEQIRLQDAFNVTMLEQIHVKNIDELLVAEEKYVAAGWEGMMFRDPGCRYKSGRSTYRQQGLLKLKRFVDAEAKITGFEELYINDNEPTRDARGLQVRSSHNANMRPAGTLGKLVVDGINGRYTGIEFSIGSGLDDSRRAHIWANREKYLGSIVKYKYQDAGSRDRPRAPIFLSFRDLDY